jgi:hypothetical protein
VPAVPVTVVVPRVVPGTIVGSVPPVPVVTTVVVPPVVTCAVIRAVTVMTGRVVGAVLRLRHARAEPQQQHGSGDGGCELVDPHDYLLWWVMT